MRSYRRADGRFADYAHPGMVAARQRIMTPQASASAAEKQQWPDKINVAWDALRDHLSSSDWLAATTTWPKS